MGRGLQNGKTDVGEWSSSLNPIHGTLLLFGVQNGNYSGTTHTETLELETGLTTCVPAPVLDVRCVVAAVTSGDSVYVLGGTAMDGESSRTKGRWVVLCEDVNFEQGRAYFSAAASE